MRRAARMSLPELKRVKSSQLARIVASRALEAVLQKFGNRATEILSQGLLFGGLAKGLLLVQASDGQVLLQSQVLRESGMVTQRV